MGSDRPSRAVISGVFGLFGEPAVFPFVLNWWVLLFQVSLTCSLLFLPWLFPTLSTLYLLRFFGESCSTHLLHSVICYLLLHITYCSCLMLLFCELSVECITLYCSSHCHCISSVIVWWQLSGKDRDCNVRCSVWFVSAVTWQWLGADLHCLRSSFSCVICWWYGHWLSIQVNRWLFSALILLLSYHCCFLFNWPKWGSLQQHF